jgi:FkbM family methyltransferase
MNTAISLHHVGGRSGTCSLGMEHFREDCVWTFYDADSACTDQIGAILGGREVRVHPFCLWSGQERRPFLLNHDPNTSSLLEPNPAYADWYSFMALPYYGPVDYRFGHAMAPVRGAQVETVGLDHLAAHGPADFLPPDVLSLDAQGAEHEILQGARNLLDRRVVAVATEVEFVPLYTGQKLFGDVTSLLASRGFTFCRFLGLMEKSPHREAAGLRGRGFQPCADALYLKDVSALAKDPDAEAAALRLAKLAYVSLVAGLVEYALMALRTARSLSGRDVDSLGDAGYLRLLAELLAMADAHQGPLFPGLDQALTAEQSLRRFAADPAQVEREPFRGLAAALARLRDNALADGRPGVAVAPFGRFGRRLAAQGLADHPCPVRFFDSNPPAGADPVVGRLEDIPRGWPVLITSTPLEQELATRLTALGHDIADIHGCGPWRWRPAGPATAVESFLRARGLAHVADILAARRRGQSFAPNPLRNGERGAA